ncbi:MAG: helix-turn-helix domain containing protein [Candidatus Brevundimonas phytovorans]|nr:TetR/AcrR family transcriptional regulator [Brevundimonas sp.]WEK56783.1 MAG: helix-turn-helix domain containing protein [Brevundimonas sp.]
MDATAKRPAADGRRSRSRQAILSAASKVLSDRGLAQMTVEDILAEAGVARATFYSHFTDKSDVTRAVVAQMFGRAETMYRHFAALPIADEKAVSVWLGQAYDQWQAYQREVSSIVRDIGAAFIAPQLHYLSDFAEALVADGRHWNCSRDTALLRARLLIIQLERSMLDAVSGDWPVSKTTLVNELTTLWTSALRRPDV